MACFMAKICPSQEPHLFSLLFLLPVALLLPDLAEGEDEVISKEIVELEKKLNQQVGLHSCSLYHIYFPTLTVSLYLSRN